LKTLLIGLALGFSIGLFAPSAYAADGCGRGWYHNGYRCVPDRYDPPRYRRHRRPPPPVIIERPPPEPGLQLRFNFR
jgi:hypothetical protein